MKAALYARFSIEKQSEASIEDQFRECERVAQANSMQIVERFSDAAISAGTASRPGYQAMLAAARARRFDVVITEDISRLWRNRAEFGPRSAELEDLGIHWISCVGQDTRRDGWGLVVQILQAMAEQQRRETAYRTRRGLEGRARQGKPAGGHSYGYVPAAASGTGQIEIDESKADVVRRVFRLYADGKSPRAIADVLNRESVRSPGAAWVRRSERRQGGWVASALNGDGKLTGILHNPMYRGEVIWNRFRWVRSASDSHKRRRVENPRSEWIVHQEERLRIVPEDLWQRVRARRRERAQEVGQRISRGLSRLGASRTGRAPRHLLSGLLKCAECGASYQAHGATHYGCSSHINGGPGCCANSARLHRVKAEDGVLAGVRRIFLDPAVVEEGKRRARALIKARTAEAKRPDDRAARLSTLKTEIANLTDAIAQGVLRSSPAIAGRLRAAEEDLAALEAVPARPAADVERLIPRLEEEIRAAIEDLPRTLAAGNLDLARQELKSYLGAIRVVAEPTRMLLYSERGAVEAALSRAVGGVASISGSGGRI